MRGIPYGTNQGRVRDMPTDERADLVEAQIQAARMRGDFDNLPGHGKPLDLDDLPGLTPEQRFEALLLRGAGELAVEVLLAREIRECREALEQATSAEEREHVRTTLDAKLDELAVALKARRSSKHAG